MATWNPCLRQAGRRFYNHPTVCVPVRTGSCSISFYQINELQVLLIPQAAVQVDC